MYRLRIYSMMTRKKPHTKSTTRHISRDQDWATAVLEFAKHPVAFALFLITMNSKRRPAILTEILSNVVRCTLGADKDEDFGVFVGDLIEVLEELGTLIKIGADFDHLGDVRISSELHRTDIDLDVVPEEILERRSVSFSAFKGKRRHTEANFCTSLGQVALNMRV